MDQAELQGAQRSEWDVIVLGAGASGLMCRQTITSAVILILSKAPCRAIRQVRLSNW